MMDPSIGWFQPEHKGPALKLWNKLWMEFNHNSESETNGSSSSKSEATDPTERSETQSKPCLHLPYKDVNPSLTNDLDNNFHLIGRYKGIPWRKPKDKFDAGLEGLHQEIEKFYHYMKPKFEESKFREHVTDQMKRVIHTLWPEAVVGVFGSTRTKTYLPTSDIDLVVIGKRITDQNISYRLIELEEHMIRLHQCRPDEIVRLDRATVPVLKMTEITSRIQINIIFNNTRVFETVELITSYKRQYPCLIKILYVVKYFVLERDLNEVYRGGLSSYSLVLMIVHFFKAHPELVVGKDKPNLGELLLRFFELYGRFFNYNEVGLRVSDGSYIKKSKILEKTICKAWRHPPSLLCIVDPLDHTNNVSRGSYAIPKIREAFGYAYDMLFTAVGPNKAIVDKNESILGRIIRVTDEVVDQRDDLATLFRRLTFIRQRRERPNRAKYYY